ncbi:hypothetical protein ScPMuIL_013906 [Solemya velum]
MVDLLRIKEEKRGFVGKPLKMRAQTAVERGSPSQMSRSAKQWGPGRKVNPQNLEDLVRTNPRKFTVVSNNGVTRSENLSGWMSFMMENDELSVPFSDALADELQRLSVNRDDLVGLEECYKKVCKGKVDTLQTLLPYRKSAQPVKESNDYNTGFSVRSYRNPNKAEILADFTESSINKKRPRTVPSLNAKRPFVPGPYFFKYSGNNNMLKGNKDAFAEDISSMLDAHKAVPGPGVGGLTKSLKSRSPQPENYSKCPGTPVDPAQSLITQEEQEEKSVKISMPQPGNSTGQGDKGAINIDLLTTEPEEPNTKMNAVAQENGVAHLTTKLADMPKQSSVEIMIGLENENGEKDAPEIDAPEIDLAVHTPLVRKSSISDRLEKSKASEAYVSSIKENAQRRKKDLERTLSEHADIVAEITRKSSTDDMNRT